MFKEEGKVNNISPIEKLNKMRTKKYAITFDGYVAIGKLWEESFHRVMRTKSIELD